MQGDGVTETVKSLYLEHKGGVWGGVVIKEAQGTIVRT